MATKAHVENMDMLHSLCEREIKQLNESLNNYLVESVTVRNRISSYCVDKNEAKGMNRLILGAYDNYMSNTQIIIDMARKFNIHLQLRNPNSFTDCWQSTQNVLRDYIKWKMYRDQLFNIPDNNTPTEFDEKEEVKLLVKPNMKPLMDQDSYKITDQSKQTLNNSSPVRISEVKRSLPQIIQRDLKEFVEGYEFVATVTHIEDYKNLVFCICQLRTTPISEIRYMYHLPKFVTPPSNSNEIFGVSIQNGEILRAITYFSSNTSPEEKQLLLIDFGKILNLNDICTLYQLPIIYQNIPAQAIKCVLRGVNYMQNNREYLSKILRQNEFNRCLFRVVDKVDKILNLLIVSKDHPEEHESIYNTYKSADKGYADVTNPFLLTSEEEAKNPEIGGVPGIAIKKTDQLKEEEGNCLSNTLLKPRADLIRKRVISFETAESAISQRIVNSCIMITVTHIENAACFYAHIMRDQDNNITMKPNIWTDDKISSSQRLTRPPKLDELILVKYSKDDYWYRAKVVYGCDNISFKVFYVDYGNSEIVNLNRMAHCFPDNFGEPFQAIRCHLMGIRPTDHNDEIRLKQAADFVSLSLLNETILVHVVNMLHDILYISIIDEDYSELTNSLLKMGYAEKLCEGQYIM